MYSLLNGSVGPGRVPRVVVIDGDGFLVPAVGVPRKSGRRDRVVIPDQVLSGDHAMGAGFHLEQPQQVRRGLSAADHGRRVPAVRRSRSHVVAGQRRRHDGRDRAALELNMFDA